MKTMTTVVAVRKGKDIVIAADGQVSLGQTIIKNNAKKQKHQKRKNKSNIPGRGCNV
jgi:ATP-dependent HslUV protease subunit HslV